MIYDPIVIDSTGIGEREQWRTHMASRCREVLAAEILGGLLVASGHYRASRDFGPEEVHRTRKDA